MNKPASELNIEDFKEEYQEKAGEITLHNLVLCAIALDDVEEFMKLFSKKSTPILN